MSTELGLRVDGTSWLIYFVFFVVWAMTLRLVPLRKVQGWQAVPMSFLGFIWLGYGVNFVIRFLLLSWDSFIVGNMTARLQDATTSEVNKTLLLAILFYALFLGAYILGFNVLSKSRKGWIAMPADGSRSSQVALSVIAVLAILASGLLPVPVAIITPLGVLGTFWILPAIFVWYDRFRFGPAAKTPLCWIFLLPGVIRAIFSPYRENLLMPLVVIFLAALFAGRRFKPGRAILATFVLFVVSTVIISAYRQFLWQSSSAGEAIEYSLSGYKLEKSYDAKWVEVARRFHAFDSLLLTVRYVPALLPYSEREIILSAFVRGLLPRALYAGKDSSDRGLKFGQSIWIYDDFTAEAQNSTAAITPSMIGDLYESNGVLLVAAGGLMFGLIVGLLEVWKTRFSMKSASAITALFAFHFFAASERDYGHMVATLVQFLIVIFFLGKFFNEPMITGPVRPQLRPVK